MKKGAFAGKFAQYDTKSKASKAPSLVTDKDTLKKTTSDIDIYKEFLYKPEEWTIIGDEMKDDRDSISRRRNMNIKNTSNFERKDMFLAVEKKTKKARYLTNAFARGTNTVVEVPHKVALKVLENFGTPEDPSDKLYEIIFCENRRFKDDVLRNELIPAISDTLYDVLKRKIEPTPNYRCYRTRNHNSGVESPIKELEARNRSELVERKRNANSELSLFVCPLSEITKEITPQIIEPPIKFSSPPSPLQDDDISSKKRLRETEEKKPLFQHILQSIISMVKSQPENGYEITNENINALRLQCPEFTECIDRETARNSSNSGLRAMIMVAIWRSFIPLHEALGSDIKPQNCSSLSSASTSSDKKPFFQYIIDTLCDSLKRVSYETLDKQIRDVEIQIPQFIKPISIDEIDNNENSEIYAKILISIWSGFLPLFQIYCPPKIIFGSDLDF